MDFEDFEQAVLRSISLVTLHKYAKERDDVAQPNQADLSLLTSGFTSGTDNGASQLNSSAPSIDAAAAPFAFIDFGATEDTAKPVEQESAVEIVPHVAQQLEGSSRLHSSLRLRGSVDHLHIDELELDSPGPGPRTFSFGDFVLDDNSKPHKTPSTLAKRRKSSVAPSENFQFGDFSVESQADLTAPSQRFDSPIRTFQLQHVGSRPAAIKGMALVAEGRRLVVACGDDCLPGFDVGGGAQAVLHFWPESPSMGCASPPSGKYVASCGSDGIINVYDMNVAKPPCTLGHTSAVVCCAFSQNGRFIVSGTQSSGCYLWQWKGASSHVVHRFEEHVGPVSCVACQPDGEHVASGGNDGCTRFWCAAGGAVGFVLQHTTAVASVSFSRDGKFLASCGTLEIYVADCENGSTLQKIPHTCPVFKAYRTKPFHFACAIVLNIDPLLIAVATSDAVTRLFKLTENGGSRGPRDISAEVLSVCTKAPVAYMLSANESVLLGDRSGNVYRLTLEPASD